MSRSQGPNTRSSSRISANSNSRVGTFTSISTPARSSASSGGNRPLPRPRQLDTKPSPQSRRRDTNPLPQSRQRDINLLLIGRSGNGKSMTGNSILGWTAFGKNTKASSRPVSKPVKGTAVVNERKVIVVDGLNIGENDDDDDDDDNYVDDVSAMTEAFRLLSKPSFSALLIVIKFGETYSREESRALNIVKALLGQNVIRDYGICAITFGDNYNYALKDGQFRDFEEWLRLQNTALGDLLQECQSRYILFDNTSKNVSVKKSQINKLFRILEKLPEEGITGLRSEERLKAARKSLPRKETSDPVKEVAQNLKNIRERKNGIDKNMSPDQRILLLELMLKDLSNLSRTMIQIQARGHDPRYYDTQILATKTEIETIIKNLRSQETSVDSSESDLFPVSRYISKGERKDSTTARINSSEKDSVRKLVYPPSGTVRREDQIVSAEEIHKYPTLPAISLAKQLDGRSTSDFDNNIEHKLKTLRKSTSQAEQQFEDARKSRDVKYESLLQKVHDVKREIRAGSCFQSNGKRLLEEAEELEKDLRAKLEIGRNESSVCVTERQVKKMKFAEQREGCVASGSKTGDAGLSSLSSRSLRQRQVPPGNPDCIELLMIGSAGNGTSSTGNSVLGKPAFNISTSASAAGGSRIAKDSSVINGQEIHVTDVPGIDYNLSDLMQITRTFNEAFELCQYRFSAVVVVLKFGVRYTQQEADLVKFMKIVMGKNVIKDYGICVITHGDNFEHEVEEAAEDGETLTFEGWCREQTGDVRNLFEECGFRCVLFDNKTKDVKKRHTQLSELLSKIVPGKKYTKEEFVDNDF